MKCVYEASQPAEAHIIKHLLEQAGLFATIYGEYLQGGVGELAASGLLKVMVNEHDLIEAKSVIQAWDEAPWDEDAWHEEMPQNEANKKD